MNALLCCAKEQGEGVRGYTGARGRGWEGKEGADSPVVLDSSGNVRRYPRAPAWHFAGLAACFGEGEEGNWRGGRGLLIDAGVRQIWQELNGINGRRN
jgi:hypothetical protein